MKSTGSEVGEVLNNDHAQAGQLFLERNGFAKEWQVVVADEKNAHARL